MKRMENLRQLLYDIYNPKVGSIWGAPNGIWNGTFAANKSAKDFHPTIVGKLSSCKTNCQIIPGTSKKYNKGSCVFKVKLNSLDSTFPQSYFIINLWMTYSKSDLLALKQGWNGVENLDEPQLKAFKQQIKFCNGIDV